MALYSKTTTASTAVAFIGVDEIKSFVEAFFDPGHGHAFEIGTMLGVHIYAHTVDVIVCHAVLSPLVVAAAGAHVLVLLQSGFVEHGFAAGALDPQALGYAAALRGVGVLNLGG